MTTSKQPWTCLASGEQAPCDYEYCRIGCGWWAHWKQDNGYECHKRAERPGWLEAIDESASR